MHFPRSPFLASLVIPFLALTHPGPARAEVLAQSRITSVTLYPQGAEVTRTVSLDLAAGANAVVIPDLPPGLVPEGVRVQPPAGVALGAFALRTDRLLPVPPAPSPEETAAQDAVYAARDALAAADAALDTVKADIAGAEARAEFAAAMRLEGEALTPDTMRSLGAAIAEEVGLARKAAIAARAGLPPLERARDKAAEALADAEAALAALPQEAEAGSALDLRLDAAKAGPAEIVIRHFVSDAGWTPVHDWHLTTQPEAALRLDRAALIHQASGEDWRGVALVLSTAQPGNQASPSQLWPELRQIGDPASDGDKTYMEDRSAMAAPMAEPVMEAEAAAPVFQGDIVTYRPEAPADVAAGVENLRIALGSKDFALRLVAEAVPSRDRTAFAVAEFTNDSGEIILPAQGMLYRDGNFMGAEWHDQIAGGDKARIAFGAIDHIRLTEEMPRRSEGDRGLIISSTELSEEVVMKIENLGTQAWLMRVMGQVPYSEQENLAIEFTADPAPTEVDVEGRRGILAWEFPLAAGEAREIRKSQTLTWPEGKTLQ